VRKVKLWNLVGRYKMDNELLEKHPEQKDMLSERISKTEREILNKLREDSMCLKRLKGYGL